MEKVPLKKNSFKMFASVDLSKKRWGTCKQCDQLKIGFCKQCGCFMPAKTTLISASCPLGRWNEQYFNEDW
jgi:hypothetical protein